MMASPVHSFQRTVARATNESAASTANSGIANRCQNPGAGRRGPAITGAATEAVPSGRAGTEPTCSCWLMMHLRSDHASDGLLGPAAEVVDQADLAARLTRETGVAAVQDQPMMRMQHELGRDHLLKTQFDL